VGNTLDGLAERGEKHFGKWSDISTTSWFPFIFFFLLSGVIASNFPSHFFGDYCGLYLTLNVRLYFSRFYNNQLAIPLSPLKALNF